MLYTYIYMGVSLGMSIFAIEPVAAGKRGGARRVDQ